MTGGGTIREGDDDDDRRVVFVSCELAKKKKRDRVRYVKWSERHLFTCHVDDIEELARQLLQTPPRAQQTSATRYN